MGATFKPPVIGEVRGPWKSSPGNPQPWQAACRGPNGWIYTHAQTPALALEGARADAAALVKEG